MAKYTITMGCGHDDTVELFGRESERKKKILYFESEGLCKKCYKKEMEKIAKSEGLVFNASVLPYIDNNDGGILLYVWFSGDTKPYKDAIKTLGGYKWGEREAAADWYLCKTQMCWNKIIKFENLHDEITKAVSIGADNTVSDSGLFAMIHYQIALNEQKKWKEKQERIKEIEKPNVPAILYKHKWNEKIYGKSGNYSIYLDGEKVSVTNDQVEDIQRYLIKKEEYKKKVEDIRNA